MKIPKNYLERLGFYQELIDVCDASRQGRIAFYESMRMFYLFGMDDDTETDGGFNKIYSHCDQLNSLIFSPETTRFSISLAPQLPDKFTAWTQPMSDALRSHWHTAPRPGLDSTFVDAIEWAAVYGSTFVKLRPRVWKDADDRTHCNVESFVTLPHNIGVYREDKFGLWRQECFVEHYQITRSELETNLIAGLHKDRERIMEAATAEAASSEESVTGNAEIERLIVTGTEGDSAEGVASMLYAPIHGMYQPHMNPKMVPMVDLYVWDDEIADYRVCTIMKKSEPIYDRPIGRIFLDHTLPYIQVCPLRSLNYAFGYSRVEKMIRLMDFRNERMDGIRHLLRKQVRPPYWGSGIAGLTEEQQAILDEPGGVLTLPDQNAKLQEQVPKVDGNQWQDINALDAMFDETSGLPPMLQGKPQKGVRSEEQTASLTEVGAARVRRQALAIEQSLDACATTVVLMMRKYDDSTLRADRDEEPETFTPSEFPGDGEFTANVDGHSSSPVFREGYEQKAFMLIKLEAIDREELLEIIDIPMKRQLISRLKTKIEPALAAADKQKHDEKIASIAAKRSHGRGSRSDR